MVATEALWLTKPKNIYSLVLYVKTAILVLRTISL